MFIAFKYCAWERHFLACSYQSLVGERRDQNTKETGLYGQRSNTDGIQNKKVFEVHHWVHLYHFTIMKTGDLKG